MLRRWSAPRPSAAITRPKKPHAAAHQNLRFRARADAPAKPCSRQFVFGELQHRLVRDALLKNARIEQHAFRKGNSSGIARCAEFGGQFGRRLCDSHGGFSLGSWAKKFRESLHGGRKPLRRRLRRRAVHRVERPELDFALPRRDDLLLITARDDVWKEIIVRVDQETLGDIIAIGGALESFARGENAKIRRRKYSQELLVRIRSAPGKNTVGRLPERERRFVGDKETVGRRDNRSSRRGFRHQIPFRDDCCVFHFAPTEDRRARASCGHPSANCAAGKLPRPR